MNRTTIIIFLLLVNLPIYLQGQNSTFQIVLNDNTEEFYYPRILDDGDNGMYVLYRAAQLNNMDYNVMITKLDTAGNIIWSKRYGDNQRNLNKELYKTDYGLLLVLWKAESGTYDDWHLIKLDENGNILDEKFYGDDDDDEIMYLIPIENNQFVVASDLWETNSNICFSILDKNLQVSNLKVFRLETTQEVVRGGVLTQNNQIIYCGSIQEIEYKPLLMGMDLSGNLNFMYNLSATGDCDLNRIIATDDNEYISIGYTNGYGSGGYDILVIKLQENGNITWIKTIGGLGDDKAFDILRKSDSTFVITGETSSEGPSSDLFMINIDKDGKLISGYTYGGTGDENYGFADLSDNDQVFIAGQTTSFGSNPSGILIVKANPDGSSCCGNEIQSFEVLPLDLYTHQLFPYITDDYLDEDYYGLNHSNSNPISDLICYSPLNINGPENLCKYSQDVKYQAQPDNVHGFYYWQVPDDASISLNQNDTTVYVDFGNQSGYIYLKSNYCPNKIFDSLFVNLNGLKPNLGNDTSLCSVNQLTLSPGNYYDSYLWQDGSTDSIYVATESGLYWVRVESDLSCVAYDSINVLFIDTPVIDLGPDTVFFNEEYYLLDAGPGFDEYLWSDNSTEQTLEVYDGGTYWVTGYIQQCFSSDTITLLRPGECELFFPNAFTPNNDGINDDFYAVINGLVSKFDLVIFNRWGVVIDESSDVNYHWDGKYKGRNVPEGVYYWTAKYHCAGSTDVQKLQGSVSVIY